MLTLTHIFVNWPLMRLVRTNMIGVFLVGMGVTAILVFNIYGSLDTVWAPPLSIIFSYLAIFKFDVEAISFSCIMGTDTRVGKYCIKLLAVPICFGMLMVSLGVLSIFPKLRPYLSVNRQSVVNSVGLLLSIFFIAVCNISLEGFTCSLNPNGKMTLTSDRSILCWEGGEHVAYAILSVLGILAYPINFLALTGLIVFNYDSWAIKRGMPFISAARFLVARMNPDMLVFGFWYNIRNFALALVPVVLSSNFCAQVLGLLVISVAWLLIQSRVRPWRFPILNDFDSMTSGANVILLACFAMLGGLNSNLSVEEVGWLIVITFFVLIVALVVTGLVKIVSRFVQEKEYGTFLCHSKSAAGLFARQMKQMLQMITARKVFLDVDELENLDNLNFTVRTNVENLIIMMTKETFHRFWCGVEITSAHCNHVPIIVMSLAKPDSPLTRDVLDSVADIWGPLELAELNKLGVSLVQVELAYRYTAALPIHQVPYSGTFQDQENAVKTLMASACKCTYRQKMFAAELGQSSYIVYETTSDVQTCVARVLSMMLKGARWSAFMCSADYDPKSGLIQEGTAAAIVLVSANLIKDPVSIGYTTLLCENQVPMITVISQEDFPVCDKAWITNLRKGTALSPEQRQVVERIAPDSQNFAIANGQELLFKILAWRFTPQESESVMSTEFNRIVDRMKVTMSRTASRSKQDEAGAADMFKSQMVDANSLKAAAAATTQEDIRQIASDDSKAPRASDDKIETKDTDFVEVFSREYSM